MGSFLFIVIGALIMIIAYLLVQKQQIEKDLNFYKMRSRVFEFLKTNNANFEEAADFQKFYTSIIYLRDRNKNNLGKICVFDRGLYYPKTVDNEDIKVISNHSNCTTSFDEAAYELILHISK